MTLLKQADPVRWGIIGPGDIARNFAQGITESPYAVLTAVASRDAAKAAAFAEDFGAAQTYAEYSRLIAAEDVEAVYIATPHPFHAQLALDALRSGKHVVTEKPAGLIAGEVVVLTDAAKQQGRFFMEAVMYRCHPQIARVIEHIRAGAIGEVIEVEASLGFEAEFDPKSRLFDPALAGGAILDVGLYPVSLARLIAGAAVGQDVAERPPQDQCLPLRQRWRVVRPDRGSWRGSQSLARSVGAFDQTGDAARNGAGHSCVRTYEDAQAGIGMTVPEGKRNSPQTDCSTRRGRHASAGQGPDRC